VVLLELAGFFTREYISSHLLLLFSLQGDYFITNWGQLAAAAAAAGICLLRAFLGPILYRLVRALRHLRRSRRLRCSPLDLFFTVSGSIKKVRHFMFFSLSSTMSTVCLSL